MLRFLMQSKGSVPRYLAQSLACTLIRKTSQPPSHASVIISSFRRNVAIFREKWREPAGHGAPGDTVIPTAHKQNPPHAKYPRHALQSCPCPSCGGRSIPLGGGNGEMAGPYATFMFRKGIRQKAPRVDFSGFCMPFSCFVPRT